MKTWQRIVYLTAATAALGGCGGGGDGDPAVAGAPPPAPAPAPPAPAPAPPAPAPAPAPPAPAPATITQAAQCVDLDWVYTQGSRYHASYQWQGTTTGTMTRDWTRGGGASFLGVSTRVADEHTTENLLTSGVATTSD